MKQCKECLFEKELSSFDKVSVNGYRGICRQCRNTKNTKSWLGKPGNAQKRLEYNKEYHKNKYHNDSEYKSYMTTLQRIRYLLIKNQEFRDNIESKFTDGMCWENYGTYWEIDHIVPALKLIREGVSMEEVNNYDNLRPLKVEDNRQRNKL